MLVLTFHPAIQGGGAKVENGEWTSARVAALCLAKGCPLTATSAFVEQLLSKAGVSKVIQIVSSGAEPAKWDKLASLAQQHSVPMPLPTDGHARAADRAQKAGQRKKQQDRLPRPTSFDWNPASSSMRTTRPLPCLSRLLLEPRA